MWAHGSRRCQERSTNSNSNGNRIKTKNQNSQQTEFGSTLFVVCQQLGTFFGSKRCASVCACVCVCMTSLTATVPYLSPFSVSPSLAAVFNIVFHLISALSDALTVNATCACSICNTFFSMQYPQITACLPVISTVLHATLAYKRLRNCCHKET